MKNKVIEMIANDILDKLKLFPDKKVLVVGDLMLDRYLMGGATKISPEAPVVCVKMIPDKSYSVLGGAANTANNISSLGAKAILYGVIGYDDAGKQLRELAIANGISHRITTLQRRITTTKTRIIAQSHGIKGHQLVRFDYEDDSVLMESEYDEFIHSFNEEDLDESDIYIISDYNKGLISLKLVDFLKKESRKRKKKLLAQPKPSNMNYFCDIDLVVLNNSEARDISIFKESVNIDRIGLDLAMRFHSDFIITCGEMGMNLYTKFLETHRAPTEPISVYDVVGAGDTLFAALTLSISSGLKVNESMEVSNKAAGIVVTKEGTATVSLEELINSFN